MAFDPIPDQDKLQAFLERFVDQVDPEREMREAIERLLDTTSRSDTC
jgi:hypothetical protein